MIDPGAAMVVLGAALQAVGPLQSLRERAQRQRVADEITASLPFTPCPRGLPADMHALLDRLS